MTKRRRKAKLHPMIAKQNLINALEGREVRTRQTFGFWALVKDGKIAAVDVDLNAYSARTLETMLKYGSRRRPKGGQSTRADDMF